MKNTLLYILYAGQYTYWKINSYVKLIKYEDKEHHQSPSCPTLRTPMVRPIHALPSPQPRGLSLHSQGEGGQLPSGNRSFQGDQCLGKGVSYRAGILLCSYYYIILNPWYNTDLNINLYAKFKIKLFKNSVFFSF